MTAVTEVLARYGIQASRICPLGNGLINRSWQVTVNGDSYVLQQVNRIFDAGIHSDIARVTAALAAAGLTTPRLLTTLDGDPCYRHVSGIWRLYTYIEGNTIDQVNSREQAHEAGRVLAQFHRVLAGLDIAFHNQRPGVHDVPRHLQYLAMTLEQRRDHPRYEEIRPLAGEILQAGASLPVLGAMPAHKVHGDPKINNILFDQHTGRGLCMLDFDTMTCMPLALELGDAMRSWCNPAGEDSRQGSFEADFFRAGLAAYLDEAGDHISGAETRAVLPATAIIYIELAARFCADALNEDYFGWDPQRFDSHSQHSETRAVSQLNCYRSLSAQNADLMTLVDTLRRQ